MAKEQHANGDAAPQTQTPGLPTSREVKLQGDMYVLPFRFKSGMVLDDAQTLFFNSAHQGFALNAFGDRAKALKDAGVEEYNKVNNTTWKTIQEAINDELQAYYQEYEWSPRGSAEVLDPVEREMLKIGRAEVEQAVRNKGKTLTGLDKEVVATYIRNHVQSNDKRIRKEAEKRIHEASQNVSADFLDTLLADATKPAVAA